MMQATYDRTGAERRSRRRCGWGPAFTLLELLVVLIVIGTLAGIAVPRYANLLARRRVEAASARIALDLSLARGHARLIGADQTVRFAVATHTYTLDSMPDPDRAGQDYTVCLDREPYQAAIVSANFGGDAEIVFNMYGTADSNGTVVIQAGSYQQTITVATDGGETVAPPEKPGLPGEHGT